MSKKSSGILQICQINISGLSERSVTALDMYNYTLKNDIVAIQETLIDPSDCLSKTPLPQFSNLISFYLRNDRGVALCINHLLIPQRVVELEDNVTDAVWATFNYSSKLYLVGSLYANSNSPTNTLEASLRNIDKARLYAKKYGIANVIILGDFNSRSKNWADSITNRYGKQLEEYICNNNLACISPNTWTFRQLNGGSVIDLALLTPAMSQIYNSTSVDSNVELFSGAPQRGHLPVIHQFKVQASKDNSEMVYKDLENTDWDLWSSTLLQHVKEKIGDNLDVFSDAKSLWSDLKNIIRDVNDQTMPTKRINSHSKPFWSPELTVLSKNLCRARSKFEARSTPTNRTAFQKAKEEFSATLIASKNNWIHKKLENLNVAESKTFWKNYKRSIIGGSPEYLGNLEDKGILYANPSKKEELLFKTFFSGSHMNAHEFDKQFGEEINKKYEDIKASMFADSSIDKMKLLMHIPVILTIT